MTTGGVMNLDEMLTRNTADLEAAEAELRTVQQRVDELRTINEGMRLALERYGQAPTTDPAQAGSRDQGRTSTAKAAAGAARRPRRKPTRRSHPQVSQSELCLGVLREVGRPISSAEVRDHLADQGHDFDAEQIRAAFAYLLRKERVVRVEAGVWSLPPGDASSALDGFRPATPLRQAVP
jgi:hypothetical protein